MDRGMHTYHEIISQPEAWADALDVVEKSRDGLKNVFDAHYDQVLFTGCGSTYYLSLAAAALFLFVENRSRAPMLDVAYLRKPAFSGSLVVAGAAFHRSNASVETNDAPPPRASTWKPR